MTDSLDVHLYGRQVASLTRRGRTTRLEYLPDYIRSPDPVPISVLFPVVPGAQPSDLVYRFLGNLLPDRPDVIRKWAQEAGLRSEDPFDLLAVYGADVAGALEFHPSGSHVERRSALERLSDQDIGDRIRQIRADATEWLDRRRPVEHAFSLGGAQGKFALALRDGVWFHPSGDHPSTHIFKPGVNGFAGSDVTEHVMLQVARSLGIEVAASTVQTFDGERTLVVERFDRVEIEQTIVRLHQEDLAQATGTASLNKYERDNGPSYRDLFTVFDTHLAPASARAAKRRFAEFVVFSWMVGHNDGHAKNYSITHRPTGPSLAPFYDLNSILAFQPESTVRAKDYRAYDSVRLALGVHGAGRIGEYTIHTLDALSRDAGLDARHLRGYAEHLAANLVRSVNDVIETLPADSRSLTAVRNLPFIAYAQSLRVVDVLLD